MENRKGSGVFLGIVSIATLIVAIIGATFAYFSASTESNEGAIGLQAYEYQLSLHVERIYPTGGSALIPLNPNTKIKDNNGNFVKYEDGKLVNTESESEAINNLLYALNVANTKCVDDSGMQVCALYRVVIHNNATNPVVMSGELVTTSNLASDKPGRTGFYNLKYQALTGSHEDSTLALKGEAVSLQTEAGQEIQVGSSIKIDDITVPGATMTAMNELQSGIGYSYVLIYLNDNENQTGEMGASFGAKVKYVSGEDGGTTLTGSFTVTAPEATE